MCVQRAYGIYKYLIYTIIASHVKSHITQVLDAHRIALGVSQVAIQV